MRAALILLLGALPAYAHDALPTASQPLGWAYPISCCSGVDCREVKNNEVIEIDGGYQVVLTGEVILFGDKRIRYESQDGEIHWCSVDGKPDTKTICLIVPPPSY